MRRLSRGLLAGMAALSLAMVPLPAGAHPDEEGTEHDQPGEAGNYSGRETTSNMHLVGHSTHPAQFFGVPSAQRQVSSDLAFWGDLAIQGNYDGFRVLDVSAPGNPKLLSHPRCNGDQGDIVVWEDIVVRSWNSPAPAGRQCLGQPVPEGFEGVHVFSIADPAAPALLGSVEFSAAGPARGEASGCGSHTVTLAPDLANGRLIVYSNNSSGCDAIDVLSVPLADPGQAEHIGSVPLTGGTLGTNNGCHDASVILGDVNLLVCASGHAANVFSVGGSRGGSLTSPQFLYTVEESDAMGNKVGAGGRWHSASFTWDGEVLVLGWEPGGGARPQCESTDPAIFKSMFFYRAATGDKLGQWTLPRGQDSVGTNDQNCTIHNFNVVPLGSGRYVVVGGHYQAGTWAVDFTDPAHAVTVGYSDPSIIEPENLGGAWSSYHYNGFTYESEIQSGLNVWRFSDRAFAGEIRLPYLNPQTQDPALLSGRR